MHCFGHLCKRPRGQQLGPCSKVVTQRGVEAVAREEVEASLVSAVDGREEIRRQLRHVLSTAARVLNTGQVNALQQMRRERIKGRHPRAR